MLALDVALIVLVVAFFVWLLTYCLRMGVVGGGWAPWQKDAHRETEPIRYWTGIAGLTVGASFSVGGLICVVWLLLS